MSKPTVCAIQESTQWQVCILASIKIHNLNIPDVNQLFAFYSFLIYSLFQIIILSLKCVK